MDRCYLGGWENVEAMLNRWRELATYPLQVS